jgi:hypothetical protein
MEGQPVRKVVVMKYGSSVKTLSKYRKPRRMISQKRTKENYDAQSKQGSVEKSVPKPKMQDDETESDEEDELDDEDSITARSTVTSNLVVAYPRS